MSVILPNTTADSKNIRGPLFYFLGPEKGSEDWHYTCYKKFEERLGQDFCAAIPVRYPADHPLMKLRLPSSGHFPRRLPWVRFYLEEAGIFCRHGCIVGYLPKESADAPRRDGLPYAIKTRDIVGELRGRMMYDPRGIRFILGADPEFPGIDVVARNFDKALDGRFKIYKTLDDTVTAVVKLVTKK